MPNPKHTIKEIFELGEKRTKVFNTATAEITEEGEYECPVCSGDGSVDGKQYINFGNDPADVLFFSGIGDCVQANEDYFNAAPSMEAWLRKMVELLPRIIEEFPDVPEKSTARSGDDIKMKKHPLVVELQDLMKRAGIE